MVAEAIPAQVEATQTEAEQTQATAGTESAGLPEDVQEFLDKGKPAETQTDAGTESEEPPAQKPEDPEWDAAISAEANRIAEAKLEEEKAKTKAETEKAEAEKAQQERDQAIQKDYRTRAARQRSVLQKVKAGEWDMSTQLDLPGNPTVEQFLSTNLDSHHALVKVMAIDDGREFLWEETAKRLPEDKREAFLAKKPKQAPDSMREFDSEWQILADAMGEASRNGHFSEAQRDAHATKKVLEFRESWFAKIRGDGTDQAIEAGLASLRSQIKGGSRANGASASTNGGGMTKEQFKSMDWRDQDKFATENPQRYARIFADGRG